MKRTFRKVRHKLRLSSRSESAQHIPQRSRSSNTKNERKGVRVVKQSRSADDIRATTHTDNKTRRNRDRGNYRDDVSTESIHSSSSEYIDEPQLLTRRRIVDGVVRGIISEDSNSSEWDNTSGIKNECVLGSTASSLDISCYNSDSLNSNTDYMFYPSIHDAVYRTSYIQYIPHEIIKHILKMLDLISMLNARASCRLFRDLIDASSALTYVRIIQPISWRYINVDVSGVDVSSIDVSSVDVSSIDVSSNVNNITSASHTSHTLRLLTQFENMDAVFLSAVLEFSAENMHTACTLFEKYFNRGGIPLYHHDGTCVLYAEIAEYYGRQCFVIAYIHRVDCYHLRMIICDKYNMPVVTNKKFICEIVMKLSSLDPNIKYENIRFADKYACASFRKYGVGEFPISLINSSIMLDDVRNTIRSHKFISQYNY